MDNNVLKFLRYYWSGLVDYAVDIAQLDERELDAVELIGRRRMTVERAAEVSGVSVNTMQSRWSSARKRLIRAWSGIEWINTLVDTMSE